MWSEQGEEIVPWGNRSFTWGGESGYLSRSPLMDLIPLPQVLLCLIDDYISLKVTYIAKSLFHAYNLAPFRIKICFFFGYCSLISAR